MNRKKIGLIFCGDYTDNRGKYKRGNTGKTEVRSEKKFVFLLYQVKLKNGRQRI